MNAARLAGALLITAFFSTQSRAQSFGQSLSTAPAVAASTAIVGNLGQALSIDRGPWVLGEILFFSKGKLASESSWRDRVRGRRGMLYTRPDIISDIENLKNLGRFDAVEPAVYAIPESPVPPEYMTIAASTSQVRLVFNVVEKAGISVSTSAAVKPIPPAAVSGIVLTPTAYRGVGRHSNPGLGLDINAAYFIGRLYGKNHFANSLRKTNYIDRIGVSMIGVDGKMQIQSESNIRPALAVGGQGTFVFRDSPKSQVTTVSVDVTASQKTANFLSDGYIVASKKMYGVRASLGYMEGNIGNAVANLSEFMTPQGLEFYAGRKGDQVSSHSIPFASLLYLPNPEHPLAVEIMKFNGASLNPMLINFKLGYFFHLNFDVSYLKFNGGYDVLGTFQYRYNHFPKL